MSNNSKIKREDLKTLFFLQSITGILKIMTLNDNKTVTCIIEVRENSKHFRGTLVSQLYKRSKPTLYCFVWGCVRAVMVHNGPLYREGGICYIVRFCWL